MQYLVLIYEAESRFATGYPEDEFAEYGAFGKKHAAAIKGGNALQPTTTAKTKKLSPPMVPLRKPKSSSAAIICSKRQASTKPPP